MQSDHSWDEVLRKIRLVGQATGRQAQAAQLAQDLQKEWDTVQAQVRATVATGRLPRALFVLSHSGTPQVAGQGTAGERPWGELAQLDAGSWHSRAYAGEPLPTFDNAARFCIANGLHLDVEIKPTPGQELPTGRAVGQAAARLWQRAAVPPLLTSFQADALGAAADAARALPRGLLLDTLWEGWHARATQLGVRAIVCNHALWDAALVDQVHAAGWRALSYTVNDEWAAQRLVALGTDGVVTDRVDLFAPNC